MSEAARHCNQPTRTIAAYYESSLYQALKTSLSKRAPLHHHRSTDHLAGREAVLASAPQKLSAIKTW